MSVMSSSLSLLFAILQPLFRTVNRGSATAEDFHRLFVLLNPPGNGDARRPRMTEGRADLSQWREPQALIQTGELENSLGTP
ncbi:MAG: hypothetical protein OXE57_06450, partial [Alphaproteobacteria bacterium]|nr:hypothetical protein [Alphaproteobacteria bacterium]